MSPPTIAGARGPLPHCGRGVERSERVRVGVVGLAAILFFLLAAAPPAHADDSHACSALGADTFAERREQAVIALGKLVTRAIRS
jgi:hypothetical protein